jgi:hypothetical protein
MTRTLRVDDAACSSSPQFVKCAYILHCIYSTLVPDIYECHVLKKSCALVCRVDNNNNNNDNNDNNLANI